MFNAEEDEGQNNTKFLLFKEEEESPNWAFANILMLQFGCMRAGFIHGTTLDQAGEPLISQLWFLSGERVP